MPSERPATVLSRASQADADGKPARRSRLALLISLGMLVLLAVGAALGVQYLEQRLDAGIERVDDPFGGLPERPTERSPSPDGDAGPAPVNILVLGSDSRISGGDPSQWQAGAQRTDAIMVMQVSGDRQNAYVMSIPRDSWVDVPGHGMNKINAAFSFGGPALMIQTVEQLTGIRIDHFAIADFESFATLTDELGGVDITLPTGMETGGVTLPPGTHRLDGEQALAYARERYSLPNGDFGRVQRQQNWMRAIMLAAYRENLLGNPSGLLQFLQSITRTVAVDEGFSVEEMRNLALSMRDIRPADIAFMTAPYSGTGWSPDGTQSIVVLNEGPFRALSDAFATDAVGEYLQENPGTVELLEKAPA